MTQAEFIELCRKVSGEEFLPGCEEGIRLLRKWADTDPGALKILRWLKDDPEGVLCIDPDVEAFVKHRNACRKCRRTKHPIHD